MKTQIKHKWILALMVISQLLLICFTLYWLNSQFKVEKEVLWRDLATYYTKSCNVAIDSMLVKNVIKPAMDDNTNQYYNIKTHSGTIVMADTLKIVERSMPFSKSEKDRKEIVTIRLNSSSDSLEVRSFHGGGHGVDENMLLRSVRLFVQYSNDSSGKHREFLNGFGPGLDSALFVSDFESRLGEFDFNFSPIWTTAFVDTEKTVDKQKYLVLNNMALDLPTAIIRNYRSYLYGQILPQILFALILIILTASAFFLAYRNIMKQLRLNEMRNSFISNISHELKTPVSTVKVALEALRNYNVKSDPVVAEEYFEMAGKEIKRLELLISKVLDHSVIEQDTSILCFEEVDLVVLIQESVDSLRPRIEETGAKVTFDHPEELLINADPLYLQGVIINLFDNSLKYGNGNPEIMVSLSLSNDFAEIVISDNGPGIPEEYKKKVFDKFFRVPTSDLHNVKGYGLGLSFAALIVEMHRGSIEVHNKKTGCSFVIKIPIERS